MDSGLLPDSTTVRLRHPGEYAAMGIALLLSAVVLLGGVGPFGTRLPPELSQTRLPVIAALFAASILYIALRFRRNVKFRGVPVNELDESWIRWIIALFGVAFVKAAFLDYAAFTPETVGLASYDLAMRDGIHGVYLASGPIGVRSSPILFLFLPLQALARTPLVLVFLHPIVLAFGALALDSLTKARRLAPPARLAIAVAYLVSSAIARELHHAFRVEAFYPLALFLLAGSIARRRIIAGILSLAFLLAIRNPLHGLGHEHASVLLALGFIAGVELSAWTSTRAPRLAPLLLAIAIAAAAFGGKRTLVFRAADLDAWAAAREIFRRMPAGARVCVPSILIPHAPYSLGVSPLDRACVAETDYAVVFSRGRDAVRRSSHPLWAEEMASIARAMETSPRWKPEARAAGFSSFKRL
jgi:hypothetical protein